MDKAELEKLGGVLLPQQYGSMQPSKIVKDVQSALVKLGYKLPQHGVDGLFGPETAAAVMQFRKANNLTESAQELRVVLGELGYTEKGDEMSSGGEITKELTNLFNIILREIKIKVPDVMVTVTSGNDEYHTRLNYKSKHSSGEAIDFTIHPSTTSYRSKIESVLAEVQKFNPSMKFINEYDNPSTAATAGHFHVSYSSSNPQAPTPQQNPLPQAKIDFNLLDALVAQMALPHLERIEYYTRVLSFSEFISS